MDSFDSRRCVLPPSLAQNLLAVADWLRRIQRERCDQLVVGISGGQGTGKSTWAAGLGALLEALGLRTAVLSLDNLYLPLATRRRLHHRSPADPYLARRGGPGTHDLALGLRTLGALARAQPGAHTALPRFDKARHDGQGDRLPEAAWPRIVGRPAVVLLEGWLVGARPLPRRQLELLKQRFPELRAFEIIHDPVGRFGAEANRRLAVYRPLFDRLDLLIFLRAPDLASVLRWRLRQERELVRARGSGMRPAEVREFVQPFLLLTAVHGLAVMGNPTNDAADLIVDLDPRHRVRRLLFGPQR